MFNMLAQHLLYRSTFNMLPTFTGPADQHVNIWRREGDSGRQLFTRPDIYGALEMECIDVREPW